jgi:chemotaxis signal transduction protein
MLLEGKKTPVSTRTYSIEFLRFEAADRSFCVDVDQVLGIVTVPSFLKELPRFVPFQDHTVPVHSLGRLLDMDSMPTAGPKEILVLKGPAGLYGVSVDCVGEICKVPVQRSVFRFPSSRRSNIRMFGIWGMAVLENELALIVEPYMLLQEEKDREPGFSLQGSPIHQAVQTAPLPY